MSVELIVDCDRADEVEMLVGKIRELSGKHRITICRHRPRRSDRQNRYYWPCFVQPFAQFLRDQGEMVADDEAHEILKAKFLRRSIIDTETGEVIDWTGSSASLDTAEFNEYLDRCALWLADMFGIQVPEPNIYHERPEEHDRSNSPAPASAAA